MNPARGARIFGPLLVPLIALLATACKDDDKAHDSYYGPLVYDGFPDTAKGEDHSDDFGIPALFQLKAGFANGKHYEYLDLGPVNPVVPKMYILTKGGKPIAGQYPIIDTLPDQPDYSSFWQVVEVEVKGGYDANDLKSLKGIEKAGFEMTSTLKAVHCPVVNPDASWLDSTQSALLTVFWGTGEDIPNPNYDGSEGSPPLLHEKDRTPDDILLTPVWHKRLLGFCWSEDFDKRYDLTETTISGEKVVVLADSAFANRFDQYETLPAEDGSDPGSPWPTEPVFEGGAPGASGYSPARHDLAVLTMAGDQLTSASQVDPSMSAPLGDVDNPIVREAPVPPDMGADDGQ